MPCPTHARVIEHPSADPFSAAQRGNLTVGHRTEGRGHRSRTGGDHGAGAVGLARWRRPRRPSLGWAASRAAGATSSDAARPDPATVRSISASEVSASEPPRWQSAAAGVRTARDEAKALAVRSADVLRRGDEAVEYKRPRTCRPRRASRSTAGARTSSPALNQIYITSGWNPSAGTPYSGAYGIPQALPGDKMAAFGSDWQTNPATRLAWGLS